MITIIYFRPDVCSFFKIRLAVHFERTCLLLLLNFVKVESTLNNNIFNIANISQQQHFCDGMISGS